MARKKLQTFSADDAGDEYTPSVRTLKVADISDDKKKKQNVSGNKSGTEQSTDKKKPAKKIKKDDRKAAAEPKIESESNSNLSKPAKQKKEEKHISKKYNEPVSAKKLTSENKGSVSGDLIRAKTEPLDRDAVVHLVGFKIGEEEFGIEIQKVQEINRITEITRVPRTPDYVLGVINLRGKVIPVINMRARFGFDNNDLTKDSRIIVLELQDHVIGILVDAVTEVIRLPSGTVEPPPNLATNVETDYISGVGKLDDRLLILLDIDKVFTSEQVDKFAEAAA